MAERRALLLKRHLIKDEDLLEKYWTTMNYIAKGHAEVVPEEELNTRNTPVWFLPHDPVTHPLKPDKVRVVYDCAAKFGQTSLNQQLLQGPDQTNQLVGVLSRFRQNSVGIVADIEAMFHKADRAKEASCPGYHITFKLFTEGARGWNEKPHHMCIECYRANYRKKRHQRQPPQRPPQAPGVHATETEPISEMTAFQTKSVGPPRASQRHCHTRKVTTHATVTKPFAAQLDHHIFSKGEWKRARLRDHPRLPITISLSRPGGTHSDISNTSSAIHAEVSAIDDTDTQTDLWSLSDFIACGFSRDQLHPISLSLSAANRSPISIEGAFFAKLATQSSSGDITACHSMVYVSSSVKDIYLSYDSLLNLGLLLRTFPYLDNSTSTRSVSDTSDRQPHVPSIPPAINATRALNDGCLGPTIARNTTCSCTQCGATPPRPSELPYPCTPENNAKMKAWLLDKYASSTFNTCPHRALPLIRNGSKPSEQRYVNWDDNPADDGSKGLKIDTMLRDDRWFKGPKFLWEDESH
ncbi:hypothetical protein AWC38_SpisGene1978 [Stylophora pistillata]|uniref:Uncharacterized protein n=1 Tax=Stylophora pistillata TaxID=50429 RepID=A0A2B4SX72_STYPI|nr:hypothetical protein AWC38_SpisGene1978 [Stylophora pistillata]